MNSRRLGSPPFSISYTYSTAHGHPDQHVFNSVQSTARLQLRTSTPGHYTYRLTGVGDASYPFNRNAAPLPRAPGLVLEQQVLSRPTASFKSGDRLSYCLGDAFVAKAHHTAEPIVLLTGQAPFKLSLSIKNFATNEVLHEIVEVHGHEWKGESVGDDQPFSINAVYLCSSVNLPSYHFNSMGATMVTIDAVADSSPCSEEVTLQHRRSIWVDVAETAAVVPFDTKTDYCVGDAVSFQLEGTPPWTVKYVFAI